MISFNLPHLKLKELFQRMLPRRTSLQLAPLPSLGLLFVSLIDLYRKKPIRVLIKSLSNYGAHRLFSSGRQAIYSISASLQKSFGSSSIIWVPDYYCNETLLPLYSSGVKIKYYPVLSDSLPNINYLKKADLRRGDLLIIVNYFGVIHSWKEITELASCRNFYLLEDCAHCHFTSDPTTFVGDFVLFSFHKTYPIPDGACILINSQDRKSVV